MKRINAMSLRQVLESLFASVNAGRLRKKLEHWRKDAPCRGGKKFLSDL